ncbi:MAG TPA: PEP-CTERM sorting domain-containing protein [Phycisphaerae bacterium]|nr:PEP-CTERM sorting domain-containing protein [Phycisphaerae bacterium]
MVTAVIRDVYGTGQKITIPYSLSDQNFIFAAYVYTDFDAVSAELKIAGFDADGLPKAGMFQLIACTFGPAWGDESAAPEFPDNLDGSPNGNSSQLIWSLSADLAGVPAGESLFMTVDAMVLGGTDVGIYKLNLNSILLGDTDFNEISGTAGTAFEIEIIPEPATMTLGIFGLCYLVAWSRRRLQGL